MSVHFARFGKRRMPRQIHQRAGIGEPLGGDGNLDHFGAGRPHRLGALGEIRGHALERVHRKHDAASPRAGAPSRGRTPRAPRRRCTPRRAACASVSSRSRSSSDPWNPPPSQDARHVTTTGRRRPSTAADRIRDVDRVEAHLHQVGVGRGVTCAAQLLHRPSGHRHAHLGLAHGHQKEKASSAGAEEASWNP